MDGLPEEWEREVPSGKEGNQQGKGRSGSGGTPTQRIPKGGSTVGMPRQLVERRGTRDEGPRGSPIQG